MTLLLAWWHVTEIVVNTRACEVLPVYYLRMTCFLRSYEMGVVIHRTVTRYFKIVLDNQEEQVLIFQCKPLTFVKFF